MDGCYYPFRSTQCRIFQLSDTSIFNSTDVCIFILLLGPRLILDSAMRRESNESDGFPNLFRCDNEQSSAVIMDNGMFAPVEHR